MTYAAVSCSTDGDGTEKNSLKNTEGRYRRIRHLLWQAGSVTLPDLNLGYRGDKESQKRAIELLRKIKAKNRIVEILTEENPPEMELAA